MAARADFLRPCGVRVIYSVRFVQFYAVHIKKEHAYHSVKKIALIQVYFFATMGNRVATTKYKQPIRYKPIR